MIQVFIFLATFKKKSWKSQYTLEIYSVVNIFKIELFKVHDPNLKLVPLLLEEWLEIYPDSEVSTFRSGLTPWKFLNLETYHGKTARQF